MRSLSIVLPLFDAEPLLDRVLPPLVEAVRAGKALELIVVDDGSTDRGPELCRAAGATVISSGGRQLGPGAARNRGVERVRGEVVLFIDSDVVMHADVPDRVQAAFDVAPEVVAVFGSYDAHPEHPGFVSQYLNLRHHSVHQVADAEASTFWAGCGAVEREAYRAVGGFDSARFERPMIEDIELGYRLRAAGGRIRLDRDMQCTHLKHWTLRSMVLTDVFGRAIPWTRLLMLREGDEKNLNVSDAERGKAVLSGLLSLSLLASIAWPPLLFASAVLAVAAYLANRALFDLIGRTNGLAHRIAGFWLHQLYYHYSVASFVYCQLEARLGGGKAKAARAPEG